MTGVRRITPEHFVETGRAAWIPAPVTRSVPADLVEIRDPAFARVHEQLPDDFPPEISRPIFDACAAWLDEVGRYPAG